jgi:hypothetical protein
MDSHTKPQRRSPALTEIDFRSAATVAVIAAFVSVSSGGFCSFS